MTLSRLLLPVLLACPALAQQSPPEPAPLRAWVNPQSSGGGQVGDPAQPYRTIQAALDAVNAALWAGQDLDREGVVHALPGLYSDDPNIGNGEQLPITMYDRVHLQGTGAKECVIRHTGVSLPYEIPLPTSPSASAGGVSTSPLHPLVVFGPHVGHKTVTSIDGFTFQGGGVQVLVYTPLQHRGRISNCLFDMLDNPSGLRGPQFGILILTEWDISGDEFYLPKDYHILNNTFVQTIHGPLSTPFRSARPTSVAICDVNEPTGRDTNPNTGDPDLTYRGINDLNIQNNLFRSTELLSGQRWAMIGIGRDDTSAVTGASSADSNAFYPGLVGSQSCVGSGCFFSAVTDPAGPPVPVVPLSPSFDPPFIGEMLAAGTTAPPPPRDWRLIPGSLLEDQGVAPTLSGTDLILTAVSGLSHVEPKHPHLPKVFDWDGEGYGSPRIEGAAPDIGFDEVGALIICGSYGNDSKSHHTPFHPSITPGGTQRIYITRSSDPGPVSMTLSYTTSLYQQQVAWVRSPGTVAPYQLAGGTSYLDPNTIAVFSIGTASDFAWMNPATGQVVLVRSIQAPPTPDTGMAPAHLNTQALITDSTGSNLSNLQFEIY